MHSTIDTVLRMDLVAIAMDYNIPPEVAREHLTAAVDAMKRDSEKCGRPLKRVKWNKAYGTNPKAILSVVAVLLMALFSTAAHAQAHGVGLSWTGSTGATSYNAYRAPAACNTSPTLTNVYSGLTTTSYLDTGVVTNTHYCYAMTAVNAAGESGNSNTADAFFTLSGPPNLGENCTNGCGIGTHIIPSTLTVTLCDTANPGCASTIPAATTISSYPPLPSTIDATAMNFDWQTDVPANGFVVCGSLLNNSDRVQFDTSAPGVYNIGTTHHVTVRHLVPASHGGNGGGGVTCYVGDNINATSSDPQQRYATGVNTWPGPQCYAGSTNCYLNFFPPNPTGLLPMQWEATPAGVVTAVRGYPAQIPLYLLWNGGNGTAVPSSCSVANQLFHTYPSGQWSAPNAATWYKCDGAHFQSMGGTLPVFLATNVTVTNTTTGDVYNCPGSANGGESATGIPRTVADSCTGTAGDLQTSVTPFYTGVYVSGSPQTDYRQIRYTAGKGYYFDTNGASPPSNPVPTSTVQYFPSATAPTGLFKVQLTLVMYTDSTLSTPAAGTNPIPFTYTINVSDDAPVPQVDPGSYPADTNLPAWMNRQSQTTTGMCSDSTGGSGDSLDYFNLNLQYWIWLTFSGGDWGPYNTGNYDNARIFATAPNVFLKQMDGTAWPNWASGTSYGTSQSTMEVTDTNGHVWLATVNGGISGGSITWPASPIAGQLKTDNTQTWRYVGDAAYWNRCSENAALPYDHQSIQSGGTPDWAKFSGAEDIHRQRTGDAVLKGTTTYTGFYSKAEKAQVALGGGYWSQYSPAAGRGSAYRGMALATLWQADCDAGNCGAFTNSDELKRAWYWNINACISFLNIHQNSNPLSTDPTQTYWPTFDPLHVGVCQEALREMFITDKRLDPTNSLGLAYPILIPEMQKFADFAYFNFYNQCRVQGEGTDNWSMSYNPMDFQQCKYAGQNGISEPYYTELVGPGATAYPFLGRYNGNATMSDSSTTWFAASDIILKHVYDGRTCNNPQGNWYCQTYSTPYAGASGVPKAFGQGLQREMGNYYQYRTGAYTPFEDDLSPSRNPCWSGGGVPCSSPTPYPDTQQPYAVQIHSNGTEQDDPTCEVHYTGDTACSPILSVTGNSAVFRMRTYEPLSALRVDYGTDQTCSTGSSSTSVAGYPQIINSANQLQENRIQLSGLQPSTTYYARYCATDAAGNQSCNTCTAIPGNFRGGKINFTTNVQTVLTILTTSPLPNGSLNVLYPAFQLQASGGTPPYTWSYSGTLPTGMTLNSSGSLSGTPTQGGTFTINVTVADNAGNHAGPVPLSLTITDLTITTTSLPDGTYNVAYDQTLAASGGTPPYTWSALNPLPMGLTLNAATGEITGTPTICKFSPIIWKVTDSTTPTPVSATKSLSITIGGCTGTLTLTCPPQYPNGLVNAAYPTQTCTITGGVSPYVCSISSGALPTGLSVATASATCTISGTPTATGVFTFNVHIHDSTGTPLTADSPGTITIISTGGAYGLTLGGSVNLKGSVTLGTPAPTPPPGSPVGP